MPFWLVAIESADCGGSRHNDRRLAGAEKHQSESSNSHKVSGPPNICDVSVPDLPFCHSVTLYKSFIYNNPGPPLWSEKVGLALFYLRSFKDTTERLHFRFSLSCIGEGNGNPLQRSCLENPRDGGAWWAAVSGLTQSRTCLKRLSSSSIHLSGASLVAQMVKNLLTMQETQV